MHEMPSRSRMNFYARQTMSFDLSPFSHGSLCFFFFCNKEVCVIQIFLLDKESIIN